MLAAKQKKRLEAEEAKLKEEADATAQSVAADGPGDMGVPRTSGASSDGLEGTGTADRNREQITPRRTDPTARSAMRLQKDLSEVSIPSVRLEFPNIQDQTNFNVHVSPSEEKIFWAGGTYCFNFVITGDYPRKPPKVTCKTNVYHPNIDLDGNICMSILRDEWHQMLTITEVIIGVLMLFEFPNSDDPLNREAANLMLTNRTEFANVVKSTLQGNSHEGRTYQKFL